MFELTKKTYKTNAIVINYCLIGCSGAGLDFMIFTVLTQYFHVYYQLANFISISCGITNNFILNAFFNFRATNKFIMRMFSFYMVGMVGWAISAALLYFLIEKFNVLDILAKLIIIFIITIIQFNLNRLVTFRSKQYESL